jgi:uncharacterized protein YcbK (DUF882 family)
LKKIEKESKCTFTVTSGKRSKKHNKKVGGASKSYHLTDRARDFVVKSGNCTIPEVAKIACKYATTIEYSRHIHIDDRKNKFCIKGRYKK